jgi:acetyl esterase
MLGLPLKLRAVLMVHNMMAKLDLSKVTPEVFRRHNRKQLKRLSALIEFAPAELHEVREVIVLTSISACKVRIYKPSAKLDLPTVVYFHGGGFVIGDFETHDNLCRRMAKETGCAVIAVDYPRAPEYKFPDIPRACYEVTAWIAAHGAEVGADVGKLIVMGDSAGGNLATGVCMQAAQHGLPAIRQQILVYPCTDATLSGKSIQTRAKGYILTEDMMRWFLNQYVTPETDLTSPLLSPNHASLEELKHLPPAIVITAGYDPLCSEGQSYAQRLTEAGVKVELAHYDHMIHVFFQMPRLLATADKAQQKVFKAIRTTFGIDGVL